MNGEVPTEAGFTVHVSDGIHLYHQGHKGDQAQHYHCQWVYDYPPAEHHAAGGEPLPIENAGLLAEAIRAFGSQKARKHHPEHGKARSDSQNGNEGSLAR